MNTKEAIWFLENLKLYNKPKGYLECCIKLLKRGEKFEKMYGKLKDNFPYLRGELEVKEFIEEFEQKYFPKGGK